MYIHITGTDMIESRLSNLVLPVREMIMNSDLVLKEYRARSGVRFAAMTHDILPHEVLAAWDIVPVRIPLRFRRDHTFHHALGELRSLDVYDIWVLPEKDNYPAGPGILQFTYPGGFGDDAIPALEAILKEIQVMAGLPGERPDMRRLQGIAQDYDRLRRLVRGISLNRRNRPRLLSLADFFIILEAASIFPPSLVSDHLQAILDVMNREHYDADENMPCAMIYATGIYDTAFADGIEEAGILLGEDDTDDGRRQFDMSVNPSSMNVYNEVMECMTYKALPPPLRTLSDRYELLYRMIKNYGIELVVFVEDWCTPSRRDDIPVLRRRLMRSGVDPLVVNSRTGIGVVREYAEKMRL